MKNLKTFEDYSDLDKQDKEKAKRNQISNFPHSAKEDAKKREKREKRSRKEDPDGMYPRDDKRYDDSNDSKGGWQDGMGKPSWLGESVAEDYLEELYHKGAISTDVFDITREEDLSILKGTDKQIKTKVLKMLDYSGGISSDAYQMELEELD
jgi:hypothetical protein